jgi:hypothetical protein
VPIPGYPHFPEAGSWFAEQAKIQAEAGADILIRDQISPETR